jgi:hypothetical protein
MPTAKATRGRTIQEATLRDIITDGVVRSINVVGKTRRFEVLVRIGDGKRLLAGTRGQVRAFATLDSAAKFLKRLGVGAFDVDTTHFEPGRLRPARPDRAQALRATQHQPASKAKSENGGA